MVQFSHKIRPVLPFVVLKFREWATNGVHVRTEQNRTDLFERNPHGYMAFHSFTSMRYTEGNDGDTFIQIGTHAAHNTGKQHNSIWHPVIQRTVSHSCGTPVPRDPHPSCSAVSRLENTISSYRPPFVCWVVRTSRPVAFHTHVAGWPSVRWCRVNSLAAETLRYVPARIQCGRRLTVPRSATGAAEMIW